MNQSVCLERIGVGVGVGVRASRQGEESGIGIGVVVWMWMWMWMLGMDDMDEQRRINPTNQPTKRACMHARETPRKKVILCQSTSGKRGGSPSASIPFPCEVQAAGGLRREKGEERKEKGQGCGHVAHRASDRRRIN